MNINMKKNEFIFPINASKESETTFSGETKPQMQVGNESKTHLLLLQKRANAKIAIRFAFGKHKQNACRCVHTSTCMYVWKLV